MEFSLKFGGESLDLESDPGTLIASWSGPNPVAGDQIAAEARSALAEPIGYPPLNQAVVPGDQVVLALDPLVPELAKVTREVIEHLVQAGIERESISAVIASAVEIPPSLDLPEGLATHRHNPDDRNELAYLASTNSGRRIYLNRRLVDADVAFVIGGLGIDADFGYKGPWSTLFPRLSDRETLVEFSSHSKPAGPARANAVRTEAEALEVAWLLGGQLQMAVLEAAGGGGKVLVGRFDLLKQEGIQAVNEAWTFESPEAAEAVVAAIDQTAGPGPLCQGLAAAAKLVRRGGRIIALSRSQGEFGPAFQALLQAGDIRAGAAALSGAAGLSDYPAARRLAEALAWADVYVHSALDPNTLEELGVTPIEKPGLVRRLVGGASSVILLNCADRTRTTIAEAP